MTNIKTVETCFSEEESTSIHEEFFFPGRVLLYKYVLLRIIGKGNNAAIWMVYRITEDDFVALKVQNHLCYHDGSREIAILRDITEYQKKNSNYITNCVSMLDFFMVTENVINDDGSSVEQICM